METFEKTLITLAFLHSYTYTCLQVYNLYRLHRPILFRFLVETNAYPCRSNYFCKTEFKATHTHVHTKHFWLQGYTSFCIQHCSLKTTLHITLVVLDDTRPIWRYFFISPPIKILDKQSLPGTFFLCEYVIQNWSP